jgi:hypothetical protein
MGEFMEIIIQESNCLSENFHPLAGEGIILNKNILIYHILRKWEGTGKGWGYGIKDMDAFVVPFYDKILDEAKRLFIQKLCPDTGTGIFAKSLRVDVLDHR